MKTRHGIDVVPEAPPPKVMGAAEFAKFFQAYFSTLSIDDKRIIARVLISDDDCLPLAWKHGRARSG